MSTPSKPEPSGTYVLRSVPGNEELDRLQIQDHLVTTSMGGVLPEQSDPASFQSVLDIGCGSGDWLFETARTYPTISRLIGVDNNPKMVNYARGQAKALRLDDRVEFRQMDALRHLKFPDEYFDLVNERFGSSWLRAWEWPAFLQECQRVTKPGGVVRVTEFNTITESSSSAMIRLNELVLKAFYHAGNFFTLERDGLTKELARLLRQQRFHDVQTHTYALEYRAGTPELQLMSEDWKRVYRSLVPFLSKWTRVPDNYEDIYQQMLYEIQQPDSVTVWSLLTAWGTR